MDILLLILLQIVVTIIVSRIIYECSKNDEAEETEDDYCDGDVTVTLDFPRPMLKRVPNTHTHIELIYRGYHVVRVNETKDDGYDYIHGDAEIIDSYLLIKDPTKEKHANDRFYNDTFPFYTPSTDKRFVTYAGIKSVIDMLPEIKEEKPIVESEVKEKRKYTKKEVSTKKKK